MAIYIYSQRRHHYFQKSVGIRHQNKVIAPTGTKKRIDLSSSAAKASLG